jgi:tetratricopeptide (TPR) repeat protein
MRIAARLLVLIVAAGLLLGLAGQVSLARDQDDAARSALHERIAQLIDDLGSDHYVVRRNAEQELVRIGFEAFDAVKAAEQSDDIEIAARAAYVAELITVQWTRDDDPPQVRQLLRDYGELTEESRRQRVGNLAALPEDAGLAALCRIVRFEHSPLVSKAAALAILAPERSGQVDQPPDRHRRESVIEGALARSTRPAAGWLRTRILEMTEPAAAADRWDELVRQEQRTLRETPENSEMDFVLALTRLQITHLRSLDRDDEVLAALTRLVERAPDEVTALTTVLEWLVEQEAFDAIDHLAARFETTISGDVRLLYALARAREVQGQNLAAEADYRRAIELGNRQQPQIALVASLRLSELLHDAADDQAAAEVLEELIAAAQQSPALERLLNAFGRTLDSVRSRMEYFHACAAATEGNTAAQRQHLERAVGHDSTDADVLIALYRLSSEDAEFRAEAMEKINQAARHFLDRIRESPDEPTWYNQYAWLIGNTEGDFDRAVEMSHKSLELRPDSAGYLDTLAHCYFAKQDFEAAVKYQRRAVELEPHTQLISNKLKVFEQALEESRQSDE